MTEAIKNEYTKRIKNLAGRINTYLSFLSLYNKIDPHFNDDKLYIAINYDMKSIELCKQFKLYYKPNYILVEIEVK